MQFIIRLYLKLSAIYFLEISQSFASRANKVSSGCVLTIFFRIVYHLGNCSKLKFCFTYCTLLTSCSSRSAHKQDHTKTPARHILKIALRSPAKHVRNSTTIKYLNDRWILVRVYKSSTPVSIHSAVISWIQHSAADRAWCMAFNDFYVGEELLELLPLKKWRRNEGVLSWKRVKKVFGFHWTLQFLH